VVSVSLTSVDFPTGRVTVEIPDVSWVARLAAATSSWNGKWLFPFIFRTNEFDFIRVSLLSLVTEHIGRANSIIGI